METQQRSNTEPAAERLAAERLAGELADVEASIALVSSGMASRMTLTGLRFGREVAGHLAARAAAEGVAIEVSFWPEEAGCDLSVARTGEEVEAIDA